MNTLVQFYRSQFPKDTKSDEEIMEVYASAYPQEQLAAYPDFVSDWQKIQTQRNVESSSVYQELKSGFGRGVKGLESAAAGAAALGSDYLGLEGPKRWGLEAYQRLAKESAEDYPASAATVQQAITSPSAAAQYVAGKAGEFIPAIGEALGSAAVGTMVAPGPGTAAGIGGFFVKGAARSAIKKLAEGALKSEIKKEVEDFAAGKLLANQLSKKGLDFVTKVSGVKAATAASMANFAAIGAGGEYGTLATTPGVAPEDARTGALIAGAGSSIGALIPAGILRQVFGDDIPPSSYIDLFAKKIPTTLLKTGSVMGTMEFFNILAEHYADPKKRDQDFSKEDWSRLLNAFAAGVIMGGPEAGIEAVKGPKKAPSPKVDSEEAKPPPAAVEPQQPGMAAKEVASAYPVQITAEQELQFKTIADKELKGTLSEAEKDYIGSLPAVLRAKFETIKTEVANANKSRKESTPSVGEHLGTDAQLRQAAQDREREGDIAQKGAQDGDSDKLAQAAGELGEKEKAALKSAGVDPDALVLGLTTEESREPMPSPVDKAIATAKEARDKAVEAKPPAEPTPSQTPKEPVKPAAEREVKTPAATDTSWLSNVGQKISAWRTPRAGKAEEDMYSDLGRDPNNKSKTRALGVFKKQDGSYVVTSIYDNNGKKVWLGAVRGMAFNKLKTLEPVGYIKTEEAQEKFYREYTPEQWADIQKELEAKAAAAKAEVAPEPEPVTSAAAAESGLKPAGKAAEVEEKPVPLTSDEATRIHDAVTEHVGGLPKSEDVREMVGDALTVDPEIGKRLAKAAGQDYDNYLSILDQIYAVYDRAAQSGETDPTKLRETITRELAAIRPETSTGGKKPAETPRPVVPKPPPEHLAPATVARDLDPSPRAQGIVRERLLPQTVQFCPAAPLHAVSDERLNAFGETPIQSVHPIDCRWSSHKSGSSPPARRHLPAAARRAGDVAASTSSAYS